MLSRMLANNLLMWRRGTHLLRSCAYHYIMLVPNLGIIFLSSTCIVTCQADVIKHMLQKPILNGRIGKWAYALVEYDLAYESLRAVRG